MRFPSAKDFMSDPKTPHPQPQHTDIQTGAHEGPIRTPKQLLLAVFFAFVIPIAVIVLLVEFVSTGARPSAGTDSLAPAAVARRIEPIGTVVVKDVSDPSTLKTGEQVFAGQCTTCHSVGLVGAPKFGDKDAWAPRIATGFPTLLNSALHGKGNMGPQAGGDYTDLEIARAVVYMADKAGATFEDPKSPLPGASAPAPAANMAVLPAGAPLATATGGETPPSPAATASAARLAMAASAPSVVAPEPARVAAPTAVAPALYGQVCQVCHAAGIAGAPKVGDKAAWAPRIAEAKDVDGLTAIAIKGKGAMPPRGGSSASDADIKAVVAYMVDSAK